MKSEWAKTIIGLEKVITQLKADQAKLSDAARYVIKAIEQFDVECGTADYTDTGEAWRLLDSIRYELQEALPRPIPAPFIGGPDRTDS